jgi:hypothetical protein
MNDMLGRPILKGDVLAYASSDFRGYNMACLKTATVTGVSEFALQLTPTKTGDGDPVPFVTIVTAKTNRYVIVAHG